MRKIEDLQAMLKLLCDIKRLHQHILFQLVNDGVKNFSKEDAILSIAKEYLKLANDDLLVFYRPYHFKDYVFVNELIVATEQAIYKSKTTKVVAING